MRRSPSLLNFLSDLCGREAMCGASPDGLVFLSDLCGREGIKMRQIPRITISKRPVRS